jgi:hypothetical protein
MADMLVVSFFDHAGQRISAVAEVSKPIFKVEARWHICPTRKGGLQSQHTTLRYLLSTGHACLYLILLLFVDFELSL